MADYEAAAPIQFPSAEAVGMKRAREDGFEGAVPTGQQQQQAGGPWPGYPGENVYRLVVPVNRVGLIIGKKGAWIKNLCQETNARVKVMEAIPRTEERGVLVSARENYDMELPPAVVALLKVHDRAVLGGHDDEDQQGRPPPPIPETATAKLLIPQVQAGTLIGKGGGTIKAMQEQTRASIKVLQESEFVRSDVGLYALPDDRLVEISGPVAAVQTALRVCALQLRKYLVDRSAVPHLEHPERSKQPAAQAAAPLSYGGASAGYGNGAGDYGGGYGQSAGGYGSQATQWPASYGGQPDPYAAAAPIGQIVQKMTVPVAYTDAILGPAGSRLSHIRQTSGATVIVTMADANQNLSFEITGSQTQVSTAQRLVESYMAGGSTAAAGAGGYNQGYYNAPAAGAYDQTQAASYPTQYTAPQGAQYSQYGQY